MPIIGKLGRNRPAAGQVEKQLQLRSYVSSSQLPAIPLSTNRRAAVTNWQMLGNDTFGDCTEACNGHAQIAWSTLANTTATVTQSCIESTYFRLTGGPDTGLVIIDELNDWKVHAVCGNVLGGFMSVKPTDHLGIQESIFLFGAISLGLQLPRAWQGATTWTAPSRAHQFGRWRPGSWGGHCVCGIDYDAEYLYVVSWGEVIPVAWAAVDMYFDEAYALLNQLWFTGGTTAPNGFDLEALTTDLALV